jgi:hypothetical protein
MRKLKANLGGHDIDLAITFGAAAELHEKVGDPLAIAREAQVEAMMTQAGQIYHPRWQFTVKNVPVILHEGIKAAGGSMSLEKVQEAVADAGFMEAKAIALDYVAAIVTPKSQEINADSADEGGSPGE